LELPVARGAPLGTMPSRRRLAWSGVPCRAVHNDSACQRPKTLALHGTPLHASLRREGIVPSGAPSSYRQLQTTSESTCPTREKVSPRSSSQRDKGGRSEGRQ